MRDVLIHAGVTTAEVFLATILAAGVFTEWDTAALIAGAGAALYAGLDVLRQYLRHLRRKYDDQAEYLDENVAEGVEEPSTPKRDPKTGQFVSSDDP